MKTADSFTLTRVILAPVFLLLYILSASLPHTFQLPAVIALFVLLACAEITDFFDGFFARRLKQVSPFGKLFDPFGDVMLHLTTLCCFLYSGYLPIILFMLIVYREFGMNFVRMIAVQKGVAIGARMGGKFKTVLYVVSGFYSLVLESLKRLEIVLPDEGLWALFKTIGIVLYCLCVLAAYLSFIDYLIHFKTLLTSKTDELR